MLGGAGGAPTRRGDARLTSAFSISATRSRRRGRRDPARETRVSSSGETAPRDRTPRATACPRAPTRSAGRHVRFLLRCNNLVPKVCVVTLIRASVLAGFIFRRLTEKSTSQPQSSKQRALMALCPRVFCPCGEKGSVCLGTVTSSISLSPQELSENFTG